jgi:hypothetical protein
VLSQSSAVPWNCSYTSSHQQALFLTIDNLPLKVRYIDNWKGIDRHNQKWNFNLTLSSLPGLREPARFGDGETLCDRGEAFPLVCFSGLLSEGLLCWVGLLRGLALHRAGEPLSKETKLTVGNINKELKGIDLWAKVTYGMSRFYSCFCSYSCSWASQYL